MPIDSELINVTVTIRDTVPATSNFGIPLIVAFTDAAAGVMQTYDVSLDGLTAMVAAGIDEDQDAYRKVAAMASQNPHTSQVKVWCRSTENAQVITFTPTVTTEGYVYRGTIDCEGTVTDWTYTVLAAATPTTISTALTALWDAITGVDATDNTGSVSISPTNSPYRIYLRSTDPGFTVEDESTDAGIATELAAAAAADSDFYGVLIDSQGAAEITAAAAWCEAANKQLYAQTTDTECANGASTTDILYLLNALTYHYTAIFVTRDMIGQLAAAAMGRQYSRTPGTTTLAWKRFSGCLADAWTSTQSNAIRDKKGLRYKSNAGISMVYDGWAVSGRFLDTTRGVDYMVAKIEEAIAIALANSEFVPFTDSGIAKIEAAGSGALESLKGDASLLEAYTWTSPLASSISEADKANRLLAGMRFTAKLNGAIHKVVPIVGDVVL